MKLAALLVALIAIGVGIVGLVSPESLLILGRTIITPTGLYAIAAFRVAIGLLLMLVAPISRVPKTLRALGAIVFVAGLTIPFIGVEHIREILEWAAIHTAMLRVGAVVALGAGAFIAFAVTPDGGVERVARFAETGATAGGRAIRSMRSAFPRV